MKAAQKRKIPTLAERIAALEEESDEALDKLAEEMRPPNVPGPALRQMWMAKAGGNVFDAYLIASRENVLARQPTTPQKARGSQSVCKAFHRRRACELGRAWRCCA